MRFLWLFDLICILLNTLNFEIIFYTIYSIRYNAIYNNMSDAIKGISTLKANCAEETEQIAVSAMQTNAHVVQLRHI